MYISEFLCGVISVLGFELIAVAVFIIYAVIKYGKK